MPRAHRISINTLLIVTNLILAGILFRVELINATAPTLLTRLLGVTSTFTVTRFTNTQLEFTDILVGQKLAVETVKLQYEIERLWGAQTLDRALIQGLSVSIDTDRNGQTRIAGLPPFPQESSHSPDTFEFAGVMVPVETIEIEAAEITVNSPLGIDQVELDALARAPNAPYAWPVFMDVLAQSTTSADSASLSISALPEPGGALPSSAEIRGDISLDINRVARLMGIEWTGEANVGVGLDIGVDLSAGVFRNVVPPNAANVLSALHGYGTISLEADRVPAALLAGINASKVSVHLNAEIAGSGIVIRSDRALRAIVENPINAMAFTHQVSGLDLSAFSAPIELGLGSIDSPLSLTLDVTNDGHVSANGPINLTAQSGALILNADHVRARIISGTEFSAETNKVRIAVSPTSLGLGDVSDVRFDIDRLNLSNTPDKGLDAAIDFGLKAAGKASTSSPLPRTGINLSLDGRASFAPDGVISVALSPGGAISLQKPALRDVNTFTLPELMRLRLTGTGAALSYPDLRFQGTFDSLPIEITMDDGLTAAIQNPSLSATYQNGRLDIKGHTQRADVSDPRMKVHGLHFNGSWSGDRGGAVLNFDGLALNDVEILSGRTEAEANFDLKTKEIRSNFAISDGRARSALIVLLDHEDGDPVVELKSDPIVFHPEGLRPEQLSPLLEGLAKDVDGTLQLSANAVVRTSGVTGKASVSLDTFSLKTNAAKVSGLRTDLEFDLSRFPATIGERTVSADVTVPGFGKLPLEARISIDENTLLTVSRAHFPVFGGMARIADTQFDPVTDSLNGNIDLDDISLTPVIAALGVEGVFATGILSGSIPVRATDGGFSITNGQLTGAGGGVLRIDNPAIDQALGGQHEYVGLMIEALKDFRYDTLTLGMNSTPGREGALKISITGRNPTVLDGQVFNINVNLDTDFNKFFNILDNGLSITDELLDRVRRTLKDKSSEQ